MSAPLFPMSGRRLFGKGLFMIVGAVVGNGAKTPAVTSPLVCGR